MFFVARWLCKRYDEKQAEKARIKKGESCSSKDEVTPIKSPYETYLNATHKLGRWLTVLVLVLLLAAPFAIGLFLGAMPNLGAAAKAFLGVGLVYLISGIVEYLIYVPMLGAGGSYLAFMTAI